MFWVSILPRTASRFQSSTRVRTAVATSFSACPTARSGVAFGPNAKPEKAKHIREVFHRTDDAKERPEVIAKGFRNEPSTRAQARGMAGRIYEQNESP